MGSWWGELEREKELWGAIGAVGGEDEWVGAEAVGAEDVAEVWQVNSHACVAVWPVCCRLAASMRLPCPLGSTPSALKREGWLQKRLK